MDTLGSWIDSEELTELLEKLGHHSPEGIESAPGPLPAQPGGVPHLSRESSQKELSQPAPAPKSAAPPTEQPTTAEVPSNLPGKPPLPDSLEVSVANLVSALAKLGVDMNESPPELELPDLEKRRHEPASAATSLSPENLSEDKALSGAPADARLGEKLAKIREQAEREGLLRKAKFDDPARLATSSHHPAPTSLKSFSAPPLPMIPRLRAFREWVARELPDTTVIVLDPGGNKVLCDNHPQSEVHCRIAMVLAAGYRSISRIYHHPGSCVQYGLEDGRKISVNQVASVYGEFTLALVGRAPISLESSDRLGAGLASALNGVV